MKVLENEKIIGIETFFTTFKGTGGKLRLVPEDFIVKEVSNYPSEKEDGKFTIADVTTTNFETNLLVRDISNWLHISRQRIGFAGTKDKRAKTTRLMSFYKIPIEDLSNVKMRNVLIENIYRSGRPVKVGNLVGNKFDIIVRKINNDSKAEQIQNVVSSINKNDGFPNFYGVQRFGIVRPITHVVGKHIVNGDFEKAAMSYIANPLKGEDEKSYKLREKLQKTHDFPEALKSYSNQLNYEKAILNRLVVDSKDFIGSLKELPKILCTMFVYAYQSYLFNKILSERLKRKLPINRAIVGDIALPIRKNVIDQDGILVKNSNIDKVNIQISKKKAVVSCVLFGSDSVFSEGEMGEIEHKMIEKEKIDHRDFIIPEIPYISSSGSRRSILAFVKDLDFEFADDSLNEDGRLLNLKFELQKGCYATSLLREFMKTDNIRNY